MTEAALARAIARQVSQEQYTGGRLAAIGNAGHPATIAEIVIEVLAGRGIIGDDGQESTSKLPLENGA